MAKSRNSLKTHQGFLRKLIRDVRMPPSRRLLAELLLLNIEGYVPLTLVESIYGGKNIQWNNKEETDTPIVDAETKQVQSALKDLLSDLRGEDDTSSEAE